MTFYCTVQYSIRYMMKHDGHNFLTVTGRNLLFLCYVFLLLRCYYHVANKANKACDSVLHSMLINESGDTANPTMQKVHVTKNRRRSLGLVTFLIKNYSSLFLMSYFSQGLQYLKWYSAARSSIILYSMNRSSTLLSELCNAVCEHCDLRGNLFRTNFGQPQKIRCHFMNRLKKVTWKRETQWDNH